MAVQGGGYDRDMLHFICIVAAAQHTAFSCLAKTAYQLVALLLTLPVSDPLACPVLRSCPCLCPGYIWVVLNTLH